MAHGHAMHACHETLALHPLNVGHAPKGRVITRPACARQMLCFEYYDFAEDERHLLPRGALFESHLRGYVKIQHCYLS
jgi:hypothetical protein